MRKKAHKSAILIFTRTAAQEAAVKSFAGPVGVSANRLIALHLIRRVNRTARQTGLPVFIHFDDKQAASALHFGDKLANAIEELFQKGFEQVITIGNDSPALSSKILLQAARILQQQVSVTGPATDGGLYLIGLKRQYYNRDWFVNLPWQTDQLRQEWLSAWPEGAVLELDQIADIDHATDFKRWLDSLPRHSYLWLTITSILTVKKIIPQKQTTGIPSGAFFHALAPFRGPPSGFN